MTSRVQPETGFDGFIGIPARWTSADVRAIASTGYCHTQRISAGDIQRVSDDIDIWDAWPVQEPGGMPARLPDGSTLWMALGAPRFPDPDERHAHARIHLLQRSGQVWRHFGPAMPEGFSPGSREWSGSALLASESNELSLYFTATGRRGESAITFEQRIFRARATLDLTGVRPALTDWRDLDEIIRRDPSYYMESEGGTGMIGTIKAFRDPAYFRDPKGGASYLFFAGSAAGSTSPFNGVIGVARARDESLDAWNVYPPLVSAEGLNNELERPHVVFCESNYYLFWSTQRHVFDPSGPTGPSGLYGMVSKSLSGPWRLLNGTGIVFANPPSAPSQAYSWLVLPSLEVISFVDDWRDPSGDGDTRRFGATFAPDLRLALDDSLARLAG